MTKIIQLVGALLGTFFGFGLGLLILERAGSVVSAPNRPAFLMAVVAASLLFGYLAIPYITVYPTRWAVDRIAAAGAAEYTLGVTSLVIGLLMGLLVGVPLSALGGTAGSVLPPLAAVVLALGLLAATLYKRDVLIEAFSGVLPGVRRGGRATAGGRRHQHRDRWADRRHRPIRLHPGDAGRPALRAR